MDFGSQAESRSAAGRDPGRIESRGRDGFKKREDRSADSLVRANLTWSQERADTAVRAPIFQVTSMQPSFFQRLPFPAPLRVCAGGCSAAGASSPAKTDGPRQYTPLCI